MEHFFYPILGFQFKQQGCPASLAVFIRAPEPACVVQAEKKITGGASCDYNFKTTNALKRDLYPQDILLSYQMIHITSW